ncbi:DUF2235 domain-containing protein [Bermanella marisrubri]|uniref:T6SS Phospholipase effector Tle1-like catalytic domain-containing protein n=1 Tax=Bermanella marisrubri TaxID=207949 RepID=Q1MZN0_9GAMM|nr:DUF2235 domain-containing protein [Bermanella marisrubri]EAT11381.1 hypothetical protein RED65_05677 [Oceanobacter sp. RED65] [Bermanella marisrubri]QIZ85620.1 DUF2235 domain-containing protein [Bermanella marisrubri]
MLKLKFPNELEWHDLKSIELPRNALRTIERIHGSKFTTEFIYNAHRHALPNLNNTVHNGYGTIQKQLEDGQVFFINPRTQSPLIDTLELKSDGHVHWTLRAHANDMLRNSLRMAILHTQKPRAYVASSKPTNNQASQSSAQTNKVIEKHQFKIQYKTEPKTEVPKDYQVNLTVFDTTDNRICMRQVVDVYQAGASRVFKLEKGHDFKVYPVREHMMDVREDLSKNRNLNASEANKRIKPLTIESNEKIQGDVTLHTITVHIPPILRMGCFFDGTENDATDPSKYTNVYYLSKSYDDQLTKLKLPESYHSHYVRGVGSEGDPWWSKKINAATGWGAIDRIAGMVFQLEEACKNYLDKYRVYPEIVCLDVFGFSRGATTARHFMNVLKQGYYGFNDASFQKFITPKTFLFSFVGLFDSVGSYGLAGDNDDHGYNFHVQESWMADNGKLVHFVAMNEYRAYFDLQTLFREQRSDFPLDKTKGKLSEIALIGAHSDVGGGYEADTQGVKNTSKNPTQLSVMALHKMYDIAKTNGVPLSPLSVPNIEPGLKNNYQIVEKHIAKKEIRKLWVKWVQFKKYREIIEYKINYYKKWNEEKNASFIRHYENKLPRNNKDIQSLSNKLKALLLDDYDAFVSAWEYLDDYYIHESHGPFNDSIGASADYDETFNHSFIERNVFFKPAVDFDKVNDEKDRVIYRDGRRHTIDIDEFEFVLAKEFK